jgi:hypothetical protein
MPDTRWLIFGIFVEESPNPTIEHRKPNTENFFASP